MNKKLTDIVSNRGTIIYSLETKIENRLWLGNWISKIIVMDPICFWKGKQNQFNLALLVLQVTILAEH